MFSLMEQTHKNIKQLCLSAKLFMQPIHLYVILLSGTICMEKIWVDCLYTMQYHMGIPGLQLWNLIGDQQMGWKKASVLLPFVNQYFQV